MYVHLLTHLDRGHFYYTNNALCISFTVISFKALNKFLDYLAKYAYSADKKSLE